MNSLPVICLRNRGPLKVLNKFWKTVLLENRISRGLPVLKIKGKNTKKSYPTTQNLRFCLIKIALHRNFQNDFDNWESNLKKNVTKMIEPQLMNAHSKIISTRNARASKEKRGKRRRWLGKNQFHYASIFFLCLKLPIFQYFAFHFFANFQYPKSMYVAVGKYVLFSLNFTILRL